MYPVQDTEHRIHRRSSQSQQQDSGLAVPLINSSLMLHTLILPAILLIHKRPAGKVPAWPRVSPRSLARSLSNTKHQSNPRKTRKKHPRTQTSQRQPSLHNNHITTIPKSRLSPGQPPPSPGQPNQRVSHVAASNQGYCIIKVDASSPGMTIPSFIYSFHSLPQPQARARTEKKKEKEQKPNKNRSEVKRGEERGIKHCPVVSCLSMEGTCLLV